MTENIEVDFEWLKSYLKFVSGEILRRLLSS